MLCCDPRHRGGASMAGTPFALTTKLSVLPQTMESPMIAQNSLSKVANAVVDAAKVVLDTANGFIVEPVGKALGVVAEVPELPTTADEKQPKSARKAARKAAVARAIGLKKARK